MKYSRESMMLKNSRF